MVVVFSFAKSCPQGGSKVKSEAKKKKKTAVRHFDLTSLNSGIISWTEAVLGNRGRVMLIFLTQNRPPRLKPPRGGRARPIVCVFFFFCCFFLFLEEQSAKRHPKKTPLQ